jgi:hypothetical protein
MKSLALPRTKEPTQPRWLVDEASRASWIAESSQWRERAELRIELYPWGLYEIPDTTTNFGSSSAKPTKRLTARRRRRLLFGL